jgi:hypothetical protein
LLFAHLENVRLALLDLAPAAQETAIVDLLRDELLGESFAAN